jgi:hypothetical protein
MPKLGTGVGYSRISSVGNDVLVGKGVIDGWAVGIADGLGVVVNVAKRVDLGADNNDALVAVAVEIDTVPQEDINQKGIVTDKIRLHL